VKLAGFTSRELLVSLFAISLFVLSCESGITAAGGVSVPAELGAPHHLATPNNPDFTVPRVAAPSGSGDLPTGALGGPTAPASYTVESHFISGSLLELAVASIGSVALLDDWGSHGQQLSLFNAATNTTQVVGPVRPTSGTFYYAAEISAGGKFFVEWENYSTRLTSWQSVTTVGKVTNITVPLGNTLRWNLDYGNGTSLYVSSGRFLVEANPRTLNIVSNLTKYVPADVSAISVLPVGQLLYLAGNLTFVDRDSAAYLGVLNLTSHQTTRIFESPRSHAPDVYPAFYSIEPWAGAIYAGGGTELVNFSTFRAQTYQGYLYKYDPATSALHNLSSLLPNQSWQVDRLQVWGSSIAVLDQQAYLPSGGIYSISSSSKSLTNLTTLLPASFSTFSIYSSGGWLFDCGGNSGGEIIAIKG
jgi:hypothetical protein